MNWSGIDRRTPAGRVLRALLRLVPENAVLPVLQGPLRGARWVAGSSNHGCWLGSYEWAKQREFAAAIRPGDIVLDIGAHVGLYTLIAARRTGPAGAVYAFEPFPRNLHFLARHLKLNSVSTVHVEPFVAWNQETMVNFRDDLGPSQVQVSQSGRLRLRAVTLDSYLECWGARLPSVMKVDVEGAELAVLQGARKLLELARPTLFVESWKEELRACLELLTSLDYDVRSLDPAVPLLESAEFVAVARPIKGCS